jgi:hypothetical protein
MAVFTVWGYLERNAEFDCGGARRDGLVVQLSQSPIGHAAYLLPLSSHCFRLKYSRLAHTSESYLAR